MKIKGNIKKCPNCKSENGFYVLVKIIRHSSDHFNFDGEYLDKTKTWDTIRTTQEKIAYCNQCNHKIGVVRN
ncbi:conserved hypothetical protein [Xenorhabdus cabanillasii JM26]|uniref:Uncharacterized protein n=1 Tax=Xenorhabdus cabanillasii JM26 TaxID=1427517 RepID=W1IQ81_9GAMM|nr:hypothetical protein Xcab_03599 [Xenorhabdus cabanillasii JM26]CDL79973.1 conserved hypothetical protein [Xenorhabdus cabanillasii JM26]